MTKAKTISETFVSAFIRLTEYGHCKDSLGSEKEGFCVIGALYSFKNYKLEDKAYTLLCEYLKRKKNNTFQNIVKWNAETPIEEIIKILKILAIENKSDQDDIEFLRSAIK